MMIQEEEGGVCPICEVGTLTDYIDQVPVTRNGKVIEIPCESSLCNYCGSDFSTAEQWGRTCKNLGNTKTK